MAGGLFSIDRDYFYEIGSYDEGMDLEYLFVNVLYFRTRTMAGGLFSIARDYFYEIGFYDEGMDI